MLSRNIIPGILSASIFVLLSACGESTDILQSPNTSGPTKNSGTVSHKNFSVLASDPQPKIIDTTTGVFTKTDVTITAFVADRNNQTLTDAHTVFFRTEYGVIEASCVTSDGSCSVTWSAIKAPVANGPGSDFKVTIIAYTIGEESFTDVNGNGVYDDADGTSFTDLDEPYVDVDGSGTYTTGEEIIDTINGNDTTGQNGVHDIPDGFFNGPNCQHSSLCSTTVVNNATIWDSIELKIDGPPTATP